MNPPQPTNPPTLLAQSIDVAKRVLRSTQTLLVGIVSIVLLVEGAVLALGGNVGTAGACFSVGVLLVFISQLDRYEVFKGFGIEARVKKLDQTLDRADELFQHLKELTNLSAELGFLQMARLGRMSGPMTRADGLRIAEQFTAAMSAMGTSKKQIDEILEPWRAVVTYDLVRPVDEAIWQHVWNARDEYQRKGVTPIPGAVDSYSKQLDSIRAMPIGSRISALRTLLTQVVAVPAGKPLEGLDDLWTALDDADHWHNHRTIRDRNRFLATDPADSV